MQRKSLIDAWSNRELNQALLYILGFDSLQDVIDLRQAVSRGEPTGDFGIEVCFPTAHDPSTVHPGRHPAYIAQSEPYKISGNAENCYPYELRGPQIREKISAQTRFAPNINADNVLWHFITAPVDIENKFVNMVHGAPLYGLLLLYQLCILSAFQLASCHIRLI